MKKVKPIKNGHKQDELIDKIEKWIEKITNKTKQPKSEPNPGEL